VVSNGDGNPVAQQEREPPGRNDPIAAPSEQGCAVIGVSGQLACEDWPSPLDTTATSSGGS